MPTTSGDSQFGSFRLSVRERRLLQNGQEVPLTPKAFDTLQVLVANAGQLVEKQDLMKAVWGEVFVDDSTLTQNIFTLRNALGEREFIETVPRRGYRFTAEVTPLDPSAEPAPSPHKRSFSWVALALAGTVAILALAAVVYLRQPYNPLEGAPPWTPLTNSGVASDGVLSPDGKHVVYLSENNGSSEIRMADIGAGNPLLWSTGGWPGAARFLVKDLGFTPRGAVWNRPDSGTGMGTSGHLQIRRVRDEEPMEFLEADASLPTWSPDGERLVYIRTGERIPGGDTGVDSLYVTDSEGAGERSNILRGEPGGIHNHPLAWSSDDWIYLTRGLPGTPNRYELWRIRPTGKGLEQLTDLDTDIGYATLLDNRTILYLARDDEGAGPWLWSLDVPTKRVSRIPAETKQVISLSGSADGRLAVATVADYKTRLWSVPIFSDRKAEDGDMKEFPAGVPRSLSPHYAGESGASLFFLCSNGGGDGLWRHRDGKTEQIWNGRSGPLYEPPVVSPDGTRYAVKMRTNGQWSWNVGSVDGSSGLRPIGEGLELAGNATWNPEGTALLAGVSIKNEGKDGLFLIPADGSAPTRRFKGAARNPIWSRDGLIVFAGSPTKGYADLFELGPNGEGVKLPAQVDGIGQQSGRFLPDGKSLIYRRGKIFSRLDLVTRRPVQLTQFNLPGAVVGNFDISPDGKTIVFDVTLRDSDLYLIEVPNKPWYRKMF